MADFDPDAYLADSSGPQQSPGPPAFDPDAYLAGGNNGTSNVESGNRTDDGRNPSMAPEGAVARGVRNIAHGVAPAVGGYMGAGPGAELGASIGALAGPVGAGVGGVIGAIGGAFAGGYAADRAANIAQKAVGYDDEEQLQANQEAHPTEAAIEGAIPAFAGMQFDKGATMLARGLSGGLQGGIDAAQQYGHKGNIDPAEVLAITGAGALLPTANRLGEAVSGVGRRFLPERGGAAGAEPHTAADDVEVDAADSELGPNPGSAPTRSATDYRKTNGAEATEGTPNPTTGDIAPDVSAAIEAAHPAPEAAPAPAPQAAPPQQRPLGMAPQNFKLPEPSVEAGFPRAGEPVASGANDVTPVSPEAPAKAQAAISRSRAQERGLVPAIMEHDGTVTVGAKNTLHSDIQRPPNDGLPKAVGFATPDGKFLTREQALKYVTTKEKAGYKSSSNMQDELDASDYRDKVPEGQRAPPPIEGTAAEPTEGQKEAGNYKLARIPKNDFGKPQAVETHEGQVRSGKDANGEPWENVSPYHYGYFNKTTSTDSTPTKKQGIDFMRPDESNPAFGDKHFIIDQKDATTGKYDEPKVMTYVKDEDTARDLYNRGFSDNKGPDRLHDITEVDRPQLVKYLAKHSNNPPKGPYGDPIPKSIKDRVVFKDLVAKKPEAAAALMAAPEDVIAKAIEGKRLRKTLPVVEGRLTEDGKPVTTGTVAEAKALAAMDKKARDWFEKSAPEGGVANARLGSLTKPAETRGELLDRLKGHPYPVAGKGVPAFKPREWMLAQEASKVLAKPTPGNIEKYRDAERLLRGSEEDVKNYRDSKRIRGDIENSRRSGDEAIGKADAAAATHNNVEDDLIAAIDAKRGGKFDVPHEEAEAMVKPTPVKSKADLTELPKKEIDAADSELAKVSLKKVDEGAAAKRRAEVEALVGKKAAIAEPKPKRYITLKDGTKELVTDERPGINVKDKMNDPEYIKKLIAMSDKAATKKSVDEADLDLANHPADNHTARLFDRLISDESGSLNIGKIKQDLKKAMQTTPVKSFIARPGHKTLEPNADYTRAFSDDLHTLDNKNTLHEQNIRNDFLRNLPKEALANDHAALTNIHNAMEADSAHLPLPAGAKSHMDALSPGDKKIWNDYLKPKYDEASDFRETIHQINPDLAGPDVEHYMTRVTKGFTPEFNALRKNDDPVARRNALAVSASMTNERPFVALENIATGERHVIQNRPEGGFTLWKNQKATRIKDPNYDFEANHPYSITDKKGNKVDYIMRHATTDEIMKSGARFDLGKDKNGKKQTMPATYYQNAGLSIALSHAKLGTMARNLVELARLGSTKEFEALSTRKLSKEQEAAGWAESKLSNFKGTYMAPELREVVDDYAGKAGDGFDNLRNLNQAVTKLLFWTPTAHIMNVGAHWFVGRGFDNLNLKRGFETSMKAMQSVVKQDHIQKEMMENGAGLIYPSTQTRRFIEQVAKGVGEKMSEDPKSGWREIARQAAVPFEALHKAIYDNSSKVMWAANDMFLTQRYLELKAKGLSPKEAIAQAERDIPNYRVPSRMGGGGSKGRSLSLVAQDNTLFAFSRYHVGMMNAYSDMIRGAFSSKSTVGDRVEALGKILALGALAAAYPVADKVAKAITGNEDATQNRRGPLAIPYHLSEAAQGREDIMSGARTTMTIQPLISTALETVFNKDFRGKPVVEPGDVKAAAHGDVRSMGKVGVQAGEHLARGLVSPLGTLENTIKKKNNPGEGIRDQVLDEKNPSEASRNWARKQPITAWRNANTRERHGGSGILEDAYNKATR